MQLESSYLLSVLPIGPFDTCFTYSAASAGTKVDEASGIAASAAATPTTMSAAISSAVISVGDVVEIPFGRQKSILGVVMDCGANVKAPEGVEIKSISKSYSINIGCDYINFLRWVASYTLIPRGMVLKMILCEKSVFKDQKKRAISSVSQKKSGKEAENLRNASCELIILNAEQQAAYDAIKSNNASSNICPFLLQGVTGSGKTEVYLAIIREILEEGRQALIMLPEIALTSQLAARIEKYLGVSAVIWNSSITPKSRREMWNTAINGERCVVIGTRSALFLPFKNLGIIVVDEEHDPSYKQEEGGFYNARDMAIVLGRIKKIPVILASATPSLESYINAQNHKYAYASIESRFGLAKPASLNLIDMRQCKFGSDFISPNLMDAIKKTIERGEQVLVYLNRRGYSPITLCKVCGTKLACPNCTSWLVYHKGIDKMVCHYCGHKINVPTKCSSCGTAESFIQFGPGVERLHEEISRKLPTARVLLVSSDIVSSEQHIMELREKILQNEADIIIGTQILAKGHHFPNLTLVGVVDGDLGLNCADIRSSERAFQLIQQVGGRAGRTEKPGKILIQTFNPEHSLYRALKSNNPREFLDLEIASRQKNCLPPFSKFTAIIISGTNKEVTEKTAKDLANSFRNNEVTLFGPAPAPLFLLRGRSRWRILLKSAKKIALSEIVRRWILTQKIPKNVKIQIDVDPISFL